MIASQVGMYRRMRVAFEYSLENNIPRIETRVK
jgi:hypothetical protein